MMSRGAAERSAAPLVWMNDMTPIPTELINRPQWVVWRAERGTKVPYDAKTGCNASTTNPATWSDYSTAAAVAASYSGIGFVFTPDDPYVGIDLDDCIEGDNVAPWAEAIVATLDSYSEVSPSGTGIKIWVQGTIPHAVKTKQIEVYDRARYFAVTGWHVDGTPTTIRAVNGELDRLVASLKPEPIETPAPTLTTRVPSRAYLERWAKAKIEYAVGRVAAALDGEKHNERFKMARLLGGLIPHGLATDSEIADALYRANPPRTEAQRSEYKTILDGIKMGASSALELPPEPAQPVFDSAGWACCPKHSTRLPHAANGNGYKCHRRDASTDTGWCDFWWDGEGYVEPVAVDPDTGEILPVEALGSDTDTDLLLRASRSDTGNAECLALLHGDNLRYDHTRKKWLAWDGARWAIDDVGMAHQAMIATVRARLRACDSITDHDARKKAVTWCVGCESNMKLESALKVASRMEPFRTTIGFYDANPLLAATPGETLDLQNVVRRPVSREDFLTMRLGTAYDPDATCPRWRLYLEEIFGNDQEVIAYIQRAIGYSLTGDTREQKLFLLHGSGNNGKSVFLDILTKLLGDYAGNASFETFDAGKRNESTNDLAALRGKRLVTVIETEEGRRLAEARVKSVTGQDLITCRFLYGEYFTYLPEFKIWLAMNHLPVIRGTDRGIWRRIQLIPFKQNFDGREDKTLRSKLIAELPGILGWALEGLRQWWERGLDTPMSVAAATNNYRNDSDQIGRWMADQCVLSPQATCPVGVAYKAYKAWCETNGENAESQNKLGRALRDKGMEEIKFQNTRTWRGLGLRADVSEDEQTF